MKKVFYVVAASLLMTSCLEDKAIEAYNEEFVKVFGETDPLHTWKMVENREVEVNLDKSSRVKIYVKVDNIYRLAADYENVSGTRSLSFDVPMGCEDIFVTVNGVPYQGVNSRGDNEVSENSPITFDFTGELEFTYGELYKFHAANSLPETFDNRGKVQTTGCKFISKAEDSTAGVGYCTYNFYPIYWGGAFKHSYGLYYLDEKGEIIPCDPFFTNIETEVNSLMYKKMQKNNDDWVLSADWLPVTDPYVKDLFSFPQEPTDLDQYQSIIDSDVLKSPCFTIKVKHGTVFGFYVDIYDGTGVPKRMFSDPELNESSTLISRFAYLHAAGDENTYITVEDYIDNDYNDFIFMMSGKHEHYDDNPIKYIYAVEDLGGAIDFDFNDVVFSVSHVSGHENAVVQPLAAGGIYDASILFNGTRYGGEIHSMFGREDNAMINTSSGTPKSYANSFLVPVGSTWSHSEYKNFSVSVQLPTGEKVLNTYKPNKDDSAPQMLILSENWLWPKEKTSIAEAYPRFSEWTENYTQNTWVNYPSEDKVVNWK